MIFKLTRCFCVQSNLTNSTKKWSQIKLVFSFYFKLLWLRCFKTYINNFDLNEFIVCFKLTNFYIKCKSSILLLKYWAHKLNLYNSVWVYYWFFIHHRLVKIFTNCQNSKSKTYYISTCVINNSFLVHTT